MKKSQQDRLPELIKLHKKTATKIKKRLVEFSKVRPEDYFYEVCFCILTPQSSARKCWDAILILKQKNFQGKSFNPGKYLRKKARFHNNKAKYLVEYRAKHPSLIPLLADRKNSPELRDYLVRNVKGLGLKEASHALRNIGHRNLAILDRHILKNLVKYGAIKSLPKSMTPRKYYEIEKKFGEFSRKTGIPMDELDLLFWSMETGNIFK